MEGISMATSSECPRSATLLLEFADVVYAEMEDGSGQRGVGLAQR